jgi:uncharacterized protein (TIGR02145 family)
MKIFCVICSILLTLLFIISCEKNSTNPKISSLYHIQVIPNELNIEIDSTYQFSALGMNDNMEIIEEITFSWASSNLTVGTIDENGFLITKSLGTTYIKATSGTIESEPITVNVYEPTLITDIDGNEYKVVKIGDQWWMAENLKVKHYRNGDPMPNIMDDIDWLNQTDGAYCNYENDSANGLLYGHLYNRAAIVDNREISPNGWHIPTDDEWKELEIYLGLSESDFNVWGHRGTDEGEKLKSTYGWINNGNGTNVYGFFALPGGWRYFEKFISIGQTSGWWSSTISSQTTSNSYIRALFSNFSGIHRSDSDWQSGLSIRCVKD